MQTAAPHTSTPDTADGWYAAGQAAALNPSAANWRQLGETYRQAGHVEAASLAFDQASSKVRLLGQPLLPDPACRPPLARLEPASGLLLGTYVAEAGLNRPDQGVPALQPPAPGAAFAAYFRYFTLTAPGQGEVFPTRFVLAVRAAGGAVHLAAEPGVPLSQITESYILPFAQAARAAGVPIYLRFAGEMNDPTNAWSRDPAAYRAAFVRVANVIHRVAPNVAMVWMPMAPRLENVAAYYPGPGAVDCAGLSLYSVPFENGQLGRPNLARHPADAIEGFYRQNACTHPVQLSEYAASHRSQAAPGRDFTAFAVQQMREVYWGAMLHFPRLKNINWLDLDMSAAPGVNKEAMHLKDTVEEHCAFEEHCAAERLPPVRRARQAGGAAGGARRTVLSGQTLGPADAQGAVWVKTADPVTALSVTLDGPPISVEAALAYRSTLPHSRLTTGDHTLTLTVRTGGTTTLTRTQTFQVK